MGTQWEARRPYHPTPKTYNQRRSEGESEGVWQPRGAQRGLLPALLLEGRLIGEGQLACTSKEATQTGIS